MHLGDIGSLREALKRLPDGVEAVKMMDRLGIFSTAAHRNPGTRQPFPKQFHEHSPDQLSDLSAQVISDAGRIFELVGILNGLEAKLKIKSRALRARARAKARRDWSGDRKAPTKAELDDLAEEDPSVIEVDEQMALLALLLASANAAKESSILYKEGVSREITYRGAQLNARMY